MKKCVQRFKMVRGQAFRVWKFSVTCQTTTPWSQSQRLEKKIPITARACRNISCQSKTKSNGRKNLSWKTVYQVILCLLFRQNVISRLERLVNCVASSHMCCVIGSRSFSQLKPVKRRGNRRYYQHQEVLLFVDIRELLYDQGFTINGARDRLAQNNLPEHTSSQAIHSPD